MHEIGVQPLRAERQAVEQLVLARNVERVPAHVRNFQVRIGRRDAIDLAGDPAQALRHLVFAPALGQQLHADADAEERPALLAHRLLERGDHAVDRIETAAAIGKGADAGKHDAVGGGHHIRIAGHDDRLVEAGFVRRALERLGGRVQIAGAVVDDRNAHRSAPGSGNRPITLDDGGGRGMGAVADAPGAAAPWALRTFHRRSLRPGGKEPPLGRFNIAAADHADIFPAAPRQRETPQRARLDADQERDEDRDDGKDGPEKPA